VSAITRVRLPRPSIRRLPSPGPRTVLAIVLVVALLGGGWLWVRDSSFVAVDSVTVTGLTGPSTAQIESALVSAAHNMTTLDVNMSALRLAVAPFPVVKRLSVSTQFPHGMRIRVTEQIAVGAVTVDGRRIAVAPDGTLLRSLSVAGLASIPVTVPPGGNRLSDHSAQEAVALLAAAPRWLRARVTQVSSMSANGLVAQLRRGPEIYFGAATDLLAKWTAVALVLADPSSVGAAYIDVTVPERPAAGGVGEPASSSQSAAGAGAAADANSTGVQGATGAGATTGAAGATTGAAGATTGAAGATGAATDTLQGSAGTGAATGNATVSAPTTLSTTGTTGG